MVALSVASSAAVATAAPAPNNGTTSEQGAVGVSAWSDADKVNARRLAAMDRIRARVENRPEVYAGISTNGPSDLTIHVVRGRQAGADADALQREARSEDIGAKVVFVERSSADLEKVMDAVRDNGVLASRLASRGIDVASNRVDVGVTELTAEVEAEVRAKFGDAVVVHQEARPKLVYGRFNDSSPFFGGIRYGNTQKSCTHGFSVTNLHGTRYSLTAGHCGTLGMSFAATTYSGGTNDAGVGYAHFGTMQFRRLGGGGLDAALIGGTGYDGRMWAHSNLTDNSSYSLPVHSAANSCQGCGVFVNGSYSGLRAALLTGPGNRCITSYDPSNGSYYENCGQQVITPTSGGSLCQGGDSGGPVFAHNGQGGVIAVGIIASGYENGNCVYTEVPRALSVWSSTITTG
ncbi:hypothetical protein ACRAKI_13060 [Saccharothrix isguenensis]